MQQVELVVAAGQASTRTLRRHPATSAVVWRLRRVMPRHQHLSLWLSLFQRLPLPLWLSLFLPRHLLHPQLCLLPVSCLGT